MLLLVLSFIKLSNLYKLPVMMFIQFRVINCCRKQISSEYIFNIRLAFNPPFLYLLSLISDQDFYRSILVSEMQTANIAVFPHTMTKESPQRHTTIHRFLFSADAFHLLGAGKRSKRTSSPFSLFVNKCGYLQNHSYKPPKAQRFVATMLNCSLSAFRDLFTNLIT